MILTRNTILEMHALISDSRNIACYSKFIFLLSTKERAVTLLILHWSLAHWYDSICLVIW